jgi:uncharacterized protein YkwD
MRTFFFSLAVMTVAACSSDNVPTMASDAGMVGPRECPPGPNVCACAFAGPPDFSRATEGTPSDTSDDFMRAALERTNYWRTAAGLDPVNASDKLERAALAHSRFMAANVSACWPGAHRQSNASNCTGFTGVTPSDRIQAEGYRLVQTGEVINWESTPARAIDGWIWTVYHRTPFQDPSYTEVGFAAAPGRPGDMRRFHNTMEFARPSGASSRALTEVSLFPPPGTTGVPAGFRGDLEGPTPPLPEGGAWPSGQVISLMFPSNDFTITTHTLYDATCNEVAHSTYRAASVSEARIVNSLPDMNNRNERFVFLYANRALTRNTQYTMEVRGTVQGTAWSRVWSFTTSL